MLRWVYYCREDRVQRDVLTYGDLVLLRQAAAQLLYIMPGYASRFDDLLP